MANLTLTYINAALMKVTSDDEATEKNLQDYLTFDAPGAKYMPAKRGGWWDGKVRLYNLRTHAIYTGLAWKIAQWAHERRHTILWRDWPLIQAIVPQAERLAFIQTLQLSLVPREFQLHALWTAIEVGRSIAVLPTASGKSLVLYMLARWYLSLNEDKDSPNRILFVVPTIQLVSQLAKDISEYGYTGIVHQVKAGTTKSNSLANLTVSTWQSIYKESPSYFQQYTTVICDECHLFKSKAIVEMMGKMPTINSRHGFSGTLDGTAVHELTLEGVFGPITKSVTTAALIDLGIISPLEIHQVILRHSGDVPTQIAKDYAEEIRYLCAHRARNMFIKKLAFSLSGTTLVLFNLVEAHGLVLHQLIKDHAENNGLRPVYYISGQTSGDQREIIRAIIATKDDAILVASYGCLSTGVNLPHIENVIFASPSKSRIRVLQSIGRGLRLAPGKTRCRIYDIADEITLGRRRNFTFTHAKLRREYYVSEQLPMKTYNVSLGGS